MFTFFPITFFGYWEPIQSDVELMEYCISLTILLAAVNKQVSSLFLYCHGLGSKSNGGGGREKGIEINFSMLYKFQMNDQIYFILYLNPTSIA